MNILKSLICFFKGHHLEEDSIVNFIDKRNYLRKCSRCGLYVAHSCLSGTTITLTKAEAMKLKRKFEKEFPYSKKGEL